MRAVAQDDRPIERQTRFRTIPVNELIDGVAISPLWVSGGETVQHCCLSVFEKGHGGLAEVVWKTREKGHCPYAFHLCTTVTRSNTISELDSKLSCE